MFGVGYDRIRQESPEGRRKLFRAGQGMYAPHSLEQLAQMTRGEFVKLSGDLNETLGTLMRNFDQDGQILKRTPIAIKLAVTGTASMAHNSWTAIPWNVVEKQTDTKLFTSSDNTKITIPETGWYFLGANANIQAAAGSVRRLAIQKNGTTDIVRMGAAIDTYTAGGSSGFAIMTVEYLETGDYVEALMYHYDDAASARNLNINSGHPKFEVYLIDRKIRA